MSAQFRQEGKCKSGRAPVTRQSDDMQTAVSILRVSTRKQLLDGEGIENQRRGNDEYIRAKRYRVHKEFVLAETADDKERADFEDVLGYVVRHRKEIDVVVFWKMDRISRGGVGTYYALKSFLAKHGVRIEFSTERIDATPAGELMESMLAATARFENRLRVDRTIGVERILTKEGYWCRAAPTGFVNGRDADGKPVLLPHPDGKTWELLRYGFRKQAAGTHTLSAVAAELREKGLRTQARGRGKAAGGRPLSVQTWTKLCRGAVYGGLICGAWTENRFVRAKFDGPLSPDEWFALQRVLDARGRAAAAAPRQKSNPEFPLRGSLLCPTCGSAVRGYSTRGRHGGRYWYYDCRRKACGFRVPVEEAHRLFVDLLRQMTPTPEVLGVFRRTVLRMWEGRAAGLEQDAAELRTQVADLRAEKRSLVELMKRSCDNAALVKELQADFERVDRKLMIATMGRDEAEVEQYEAEAVVGTCAYFLEHVVELWEKWPLEGQTTVQRLVFPAGLPFDALRGSRTPTLSPVYAAFAGSLTPGSQLAAPPHQVSNPVIREMIAWYKLLQVLPEEEKAALAV